MSFEELCWKSEALWLLATVNKVVNGEKDFHNFSEIILIGISKQPGFVEVLIEFARNFEWILRTVESIWRTFLKGSSRP